MLWRLELATVETGSGRTTIESDVLSLGFQHGSDNVLRFSGALNGTGAFTLTLERTAAEPAAFVIGQRELLLYGDDGGGEDLLHVWRLWDAKLKGRWVTFTGDGIYADLRRRRLADDFFRTDDDQLDIAWEAIAYTQGRTGGNLGITRGSVTPSGVTRSVEFCGEQRQPIGGLIEDFSEADDGFDFEVGADRVWRTWFPKRGIDRSATVILNGETNVTEFERDVSARALENSVASIPKNLECAPLSYYTAVDATSRSAYTLLEGEVVRTDLEETAFVDALADEELRIMKDPADLIRATMDSRLAASPSIHAGDFELGDTVNARATYGGFGTFNRNYRVMGYQTTLKQGNVDLTTYDLDGAI